MAHVTALAVAPVKGMRVVEVDRVDVDAAGARGDRAFFVRRPEDGKIASTSRHARLVQVVPAYDAGAGRLSLAFPGGDVVEGDVSLGGTVQTAFYDGRPVSGRVVGGPFAAAIGEHLGRPVELVARDTAERGGDDAPATLMSEASLAAVARAGGDDAVDGRRFRMTLTVAGVGEWEEHGWGGRELRIGDAVLRVDAPVVRCAVTTRDPDDGRRDLPILKTLAALRGKRDVTFGVWLDVVRPGAIRRGDAVTPA